MKPRASGHGRNAFTLIELLCVIAIVGLLAALLLPALGRSRTRVLRIECVSNLRQIGVAFHAFAHDHDGDFPMAILPLARSSQPRPNTPASFTPVFGPASRYFQAASNELVTPRILICPADTRQPAAALAFVKNENMSYFLGLNATMARPSSILAGDRNITNDWIPNLTVARLGPENFLRWTHELHQFKGNLLFADGHVEELNTPNLQSVSPRAGPVASLLLPTITPAAGVAPGPGVASNNGNARTGIGLASDNGNTGTGMGMASDNGNARTGMGESKQESRVPAASVLAQTGAQMADVKAVPPQARAIKGALDSTNRLISSDATPVYLTAMAPLEGMTRTRTWPLYLLLLLLSAIALFFTARRLLKASTRTTGERNE